MNQSLDERLQQASLLLGRQLESRVHDKVVFAESCTAGLVAASLAQVPGISRFLVGSFVTYQEAAKMAWLNVSQSSLQQHSAESEFVTAEMATGALKQTADANWSATVTGHLGPGAPEPKDGVVYVVVARRVESEVKVVSSRRIQLESEERTSRQKEAACFVLEMLCEVMNEKADG